MGVRRQKDMALYCEGGLHRQLLCGARGTKHAASLRQQATFYGLQICGRARRCAIFPQWLCPHCDISCGPKCHDQLPAVDTPELLKYASAVLNDHREHGLFWERFDERLVDTKQDRPREVAKRHRLPGLEEFVWH